MRWTTFATLRIISGNSSKNRPLSTWLVGAKIPIAPRTVSARDSEADVTVDPTEESPETVVTAETDVGADVGFEVSGVEPALNQVVQSTKRGGHTTVVSVFEDRAEMDPNDVSMMERSMNGARAYHGGARSRDDYETAIGMLDAGYFDGDSLVTDRIGLDEIVESGFEKLTGDKSSVKIIVEQE